MTVMIAIWWTKPTTSRGFVRTTAIFVPEFAETGA